MTDALNVHGYYIRKIIKFCKSIGPFRDLSPEDQLIVLKGFHCEFGLIRVSFDYEQNKDGYRVINVSIFFCFVILNFYKNNILFIYFTAGR